MSELYFQNASHLLEPNPPERSYGVSIVDLAGDGTPQILVATVAGPNRLYRWNPDGGVFEDGAPRLLADAECSAIGVACADAEGTGRLSPYILNTSVFEGPDSEPDRLLLNLGGLRFEDALADNLDCNHGAGRSVCWLDVYGDERYFAFLANYGVPGVLIGKGKNFYRNFAHDLGLDRRTGGRGLVAQPIFGGPLSDIFCVNENGRNFLYRNEGGGKFTDVAAAAGVADEEEHGRGVCVADLNRDGLPDLIWGNWQGEHRICLQQADGFFRPNCCTYEFAMPSRVRTVICADLDNDGWDEIFLNHLGEPNRLYRYGPGRRVVELDPGPLALEEAQGTGAAVGDLNGDGFLDLFIAHGESHLEPNELYLNQPNGNHWLRVLPLTRAGAPAIGAAVRVSGAGALPPQIKFLDGGSGYLCQMEPIAHFGLGEATEAGLVEITWPTGAKKQIRGIGADQVIQVRHP
jgi:hypothetical protein